MPIMHLEKEERNKETYSIDDDLVCLARRLHVIKYTIMFVAGEWMGKEKLSVHKLKQNLLDESDA